MPYSALWIFNKLSECRSVGQWARERNQYFHKMNLKDKNMNSVADALQYAVKRCKEADNIYMFHRTMSQGSEGMNGVNHFPRFGLSRNTEFETLK